MGTGVGEAMLLGAVTGAGTSAITGGDPLKGALFGLAGAGLTSGLSGAITGAAEGSAASAGTTAASSFAPDVSKLMATETGLFDPTSLKTFGSQGEFVNQAAANQIGQMQNLSPQLKDLFTENVLKYGQNPAEMVGQATTYNDLAANKFDQYKGISSGDALSRKGDRDFMQGIQEYIVNNPGKTAAFGGVAANMLFNQPGMEMPDTEYKGPLSRFRFNPYTYRPSYMAEGGIADVPVSQKYARGGDLGGYSDGGRMLKGPGDGMSDSIPARIGARQPARLADGEFVVPADVVSHLGNGSTDAGAKQLYAMMDKVRKARTGTKKQGRAIKPGKYMPA